MSLRGYMGTDTLKLYPNGFDHYFSVFIYDDCFNETVYPSTISGGSSKYYVVSDVAKLITFSKFTHLNSVGHKTECGDLSYSLSSEPENFVLAFKIIPGTTTV